MAWLKGLAHRWPGLSKKIVATFFQSTWHFFLKPLSREAGANLSSTKVQQHLRFQGVHRLAKRTLFFISPAQSPMRIGKHIPSPLRQTVTSAISPSKPIT